MANTVTQRVLRAPAAGKEGDYVVLVTIVSDGTEEADLVIYDNSAYIADVARGNVQSIKANGSSCQCLLEWDQTTDSPIFVFDPSNNVDIDFRCIGGIPNPGGSGATGDIVLTTTNLDAGDVVSILLHVKQ